jgi:hypothetical protein
MEEIDAEHDPIAKKDLEAQLEEIRESNNETVPY